MNLDTPEVGSDLFWRSPERVEASPDPDTATAQTVEIMCQHANKSADDEAVQWIASSALQQFGMLAFGFAGNQDDEARFIESAWWWCKNNIRFVHHELLLRRWLGERDHLQGLISPDVLARMDNPEGDCAIFSMMLAALLRSRGIPYEVVTVAVNPREPSIFSHVYIYAVMRDGRRVPLDASHGDYPGWQVPRSDVYRLQVWDESGRPVADRGSRFDGLHNYAIRGLGTDPYDGLDPTIDPIIAGTLTPIVATDPAYPAYVPQPGTSVDAYGNIIYGVTGSGYNPAVPTGGMVAPSQNSAQWAAFATAAMKSGLTLAEINSIQPGTVVGANGQILRQTAGFAVPTPIGSQISTALGGSSVLMLGGLALGALVLFSMLGKK